MQKSFTSPKLFTLSSDFNNPSLRSFDITEALLKGLEFEKLQSSIYSYSTGLPQLSSSDFVSDPSVATLIRKDHYVNWFSFRS